MHYYPDGRRVAVSGFPTNLRNSFYRFKPLTFLNRLPDNRIIVGAQFGWVEIDAVKDEVKGEYLAWRSIKTNANCCYEYGPQLLLAPEQITPTLTALMRDTQPSSYI
jgi:hypothetical protein